MKRAWVILMIAAASGAWAADAPAGKQIFSRYCAECHAPGFGHPGTQQLALLRGAVSSILEQRKDLAPDYIRYVVRHGLWEMPPYRTAEIDDAQLAQLARYLAPGTKATAQGN
jgi:(+)-pinoresinol hydroxylase